MSLETLLAVTRSLTIQSARSRELQIDEPDKENDAHETFDTLVLAREELARRRHYERKSQDWLSEKLIQTKRTLKQTSREQQDVLHQYEHPSPFSRRDKTTEAVLEQRLRFFHEEKHRLINDVETIVLFLKRKD